MAEYIDRNGLIEALNKFAPEHYNALINQLITKYPTSDVVEVKHGEWQLKSETRQLLDDYDEDTYIECPFCKRTFYVPFEFEDEKMLEYARKNYPYCNCGAKMDGGKAE